MRHSKDAESQPDEGGAAGIAESGARYGLFVAPQQGMASLIEALAHRLTAGVVRLSSPVSRMAREDGGWTLSTASQSEPQRFDALVVALPAPAAAKLLHDADRELADELAQIEYAGCAIVSLGYRRDQIASLPAGFGFVVPIIEGRRILAASFASEKFPQRAPDDRVVIRVFIGGALQSQLVELSEQELGQMAHEELVSLLRIAGSPSWTDVAKWPGSMPQYHVGHLARVARIAARVATFPGLELVGNAYQGVGIPQCIHIGESAAERIAALWA